MVGYLSITKEQFTTITFRVPITHERWKGKYGEPEFFKFCAASENSAEGDVVHIKIFGQHMIYLTSQSAIWELLVKRSSIYSDRLPFRILLDPSL